MTRGKYRNSIFVYLLLQNMITDIKGILVVDKLEKLLFYLMSEHFKRHFPLTTYLNVI